jgi:hypothetical protein
MSRSSNWSFTPFPFVRQKSVRESTPILKQKMIETQHIISDVSTLLDRREEQEQEARDMDALLKEIDVVRHRAEERLSEKTEEVVEMDGLLNEIHQSRIGYIRELTTEKRKLDKEERIKERQAKRERRETELQRIARQQRRFIKSQAQVMRALQKERIQEAKRQEEAEGWKVVTYKKVREAKSKSRRTAH